jgi:serine/threonine-protein kinase
MTRADATAVQLPNGTACASKAQAMSNSPERERPGEMVRGTVLASKYRLERPLAVGRQAWVWLARDLVLDLPVAIKLARSDVSDPRLRARRTSDEARLVARLGHPAIVRVIDVALGHDGVACLVMEFLSGETLARRLERGRLAPEMAVRLMLPIADALLLAHRRGVVHRDVKPANVFLVTDGTAVQPKLMDFGLAQLAGTPPGKGPEPRVVAGTPFYVSPEQAGGCEVADRRSDVWSYCVTLYECVTRTPPFVGSSWPRVRQSILEDEPRSLSEAGVDDERLWGILRRGLAKSREARWPGVLSLGRELASWLLSKGVNEDACGTSVSARWLSRSPLSVDIWAASSAGFGPH